MKGSRDRYYKNPEKARDNSSAVIKIFRVRIKDGQEGTVTDSPLNRRNWSGVQEVEQIDRTGGI